MAKREHKPVSHVALDFDKPQTGVLCGASFFESVTLAAKDVNCDGCKLRLAAVSKMKTYKTEEKLRLAIKALKKIANHRSYACDALPMATATLKEIE